MKLSVVRSKCRRKTCSSRLSTNRGFSGCKWQKSDESSAVFANESSSLGWDERTKSRFLFALPNPASCTFVTSIDLEMPSPPVRFFSLFTGKNEKKAGIIRRRASEQVAIARSHRLRRQSVFFSLLRIYIAPPLAPLLLTASVLLPPRI